MRQRGRIFEPVFAQFKHSGGIRRWSLRGLAAVRARWALLCTNWNLQEFQRLRSGLRANTKFDRLSKRGAANLFYVVAEPGLVASATLPCGWGLLERQGEGLVLKVKSQSRSAFSINSSLR